MKGLHVRKDPMANSRKISPSVPTELDVNTASLGAMDWRSKYFHPVKLHVLESVESIETSQEGKEANDSLSPGLIAVVLVFWSYASELVADDAPSSTASAIEPLRDCRLAPACNEKSLLISIPKTCISASPPSSSSSSSPFSLPG